MPHFSPLLATIFTLLFLSQFPAAAQANRAEAQQWHGMLIKRRGVMLEPTYRTRTKVVKPKPARQLDIRVASSLVKAAGIAEARARSRSQRLCWRFVKTALVKAAAVKSYPNTAYARQAARELVREHGFVRLPIRDPYEAPTGAILVYGGKGPGHVEIRTRKGFVSDYRSVHPCGLPFLGAFIKTAGR